MAADNASLQRQKSRQEEIFRTQQQTQQKEQNAGNLQLNENVTDLKKQVLRADNAKTDDFAAAAADSLGAVAVKKAAAGAMSVKYRPFFQSNKSLYHRQREQWRGSRA